MTEAHYKVVAEAAGDGNEAVELYKTTRPDVVTMDVVVPQMSGIVATRRILKMDKDAKVVIISAMGQENLVMEAINVGAKDYILKPFSAEEVTKNRRSRICSRRTCESCTRFTSGSKKNCLRRLKEPCRGLSDALPDQFTFYHLGEVKKLADSSQKISKTLDLSELQGVAFSLQGEKRGVIAVLFDKDLDFSTYRDGQCHCPVAEPISLAQDLEVDVMVSPPRFLSEGRIASLLKSELLVDHQCFSHIHNGNVVDVQTVILSAPPEGA